MKERSDPDKRETITMEVRRKRELLLLENCSYITKEDQSLVRSIKA